MLFRSDRKSTRLNSSHLVISYAVFCLKKKKTKHDRTRREKTAQTDGMARDVTPESTRRCMVRRSHAHSIVLLPFLLCFFFFFNDTATTEIYTLSLHDALPICKDWQISPNRTSFVESRQ